MLCREIAEQLAGFSGSKVNFIATNPLFTIHNGSTTFFTGDMELLTYSSG
jgi:hypothetical protein